MKGGRERATERRLEGQPGRLMVGLESVYDDYFTFVRNKCDAICDLVRCFEYKLICHLQSFRSVRWPKGKRTLWVLVLRPFEKHLLWCSGLFFYVTDKFARINDDNVRFCKSQICCNFTNLYVEALCFCFSFSFHDDALKLWSSGQVRE